MGSPKSEFPTQCWGGGHFLSNYFLTVKKKGGGSFIYIHLFFLIQKISVKIAIFDALNKLFSYI